MGQNVYASGGIKKDSPFFMNQAVTLWYEEVAILKGDVISAYKKTP